MKSVTARNAALPAYRLPSLQITLPLPTRRGPQLDAKEKHEVLIALARLLLEAAGKHDPGSPNDRLLLGLKGTMSEFELTLLRRRKNREAL